MATGSIAGFLRLFLDAQGSVAAQGRLSNGKPVPSKFELKLLAGKWSDEVGIVFSRNRAKETVPPAVASPSADYVPIKDADRRGARLGGSPDPFAPFPKKPRRMHQRTYRRLRAQARAAEAITLGRR